METPKWKKFETLVSQIHQGLAPSSKIEHNVNVMGKNSKTLRQIDISIKSHASGYELFVIVECKDVGRPIELGVVDGFISKIADVGANKGVIVTSSGFTEGAKKQAKQSGIELLTLKAAQRAKWNSLLSFKCILDTRSLDRFWVFPKEEVECLSQAKSSIEVEVWNEKGEYIDKVGNLLGEMWNKGALPLYFILPIYS